jgi:hypothetical protein
MRSERVNSFVQVILTIAASTRGGWAGRRFGNLVIGVAVSVSLTVVKFKSFGSRRAVWCG